MISVNLRQAKELIRMAIDLKKPVISLGTPGIGKTEITEQVAAEKEMGFLCFEAPSLDPTDARGLMYVIKDEAHFTKSPLLPNVKAHGEKGVLLIDEITSGLPSVQTALHALFHPREKRLGNDRIPDGWIPMATGNYSSDGAGAYSLLTALSDRALIMNIVSDMTVWKEDYALPKNVHPITIGLLNFRPNLFDTFAERAKQDKGKAFATARTHTQVSDVLYYADKINMDSGLLLPAIAGYVGEGIASEYMAFRKMFNELPDPKMIFSGENIVPKEPSILYALCAAVVAHLKDIKMPVQKAIDRLLDYSTHLDAEFGGLLIRDVYVNYRENITKSKLWVSVASRYCKLKD